MEIGASVDAAVCALLLLGGTGSNLAKRPPLKLIFVLFGELGGFFVVGGLANDFVGLANLRTEGVGEAFLDEADGEVGDVDADPAAVEALGYLNCGSTAAEGIKDYVAFIG